MSTRPQEALDRALSPAFVNIAGTFIILALFGVILGAYAALWHENPLAVFYGESGSSTLIVSLAIFFVSIFVHELLHGIGYRMGGVQWRDITFGFQWKALMPYAHCKVALRANAYRLAVALPGIVLGVIPTAAGILFHLDWAMLYGAAMLAGAVGDMMILALLVPIKADRIIRDHATKPGFQIVSEL